MIFHQASDDNREFFIHDIPGHSVPFRIRVDYTGGANALHGHILDKQVLPEIRSRLQNNPSTNDQTMSVAALQPTVSAVGSLMPLMSSALNACREEIRWNAALHLEKGVIQRVCVTHLSPLPPGLGLADIRKGISEALGVDSDIVILG